MSADARRTVGEGDGVGAGPGTGTAEKGVCAGAVGEAEGPGTGTAGEGVCTGAVGEAEGPEQFQAGKHATHSTFPRDWTATLQAVYGGCHRPPEKCAQSRGSKQNPTSAHDAQNASLPVAGPKADKSRKRVRVMAIGLGLQDMK